MDLYKNYERLMTAVISQACKDYCYSVIGVNKYGPRSNVKDKYKFNFHKKRIKELVTFFHGDMKVFESNEGNIDPGDLIKRLNVISKNSDEYSIIKMFKY